MRSFVLKQEKEMIRKALVSDSEAILEIIKPYVESEIILPKTLEEISGRIRDYFVFEEEGTVQGCAALYPGWDSLGEIRTTAVREENKGKGIGRQLVEACIEDARELGLPKIFVLTYEVDFFEKMGFSVVEKETLPHKIFKDCIKCRHFFNCDETAMIKALQE